MHMTTQNYCMVNEANNVCENICVWDGDPNTWTPPAGYLMLIQATTPAKVWVWNAVSQVWELGEQMGAGQIGFTWDGTYLTTNDPQPAPVVQAQVSGAQTL